MFWCVLVAEVEDSSSDRSSFGSRIKGNIGLNVKLHVADAKDQFIVGIKVTVLEKSGRLGINGNGGLDMKRAEKDHGGEYGEVHGSVIINKRAVDAAETTGV